MYNDIPMLQAEKIIHEKSGISVQSFTKMRGQDCSVHWHNYYTLDIILDGSGEHFLNGKTYAIQRGDIYLVKPTDIHSVRGDELHLFSVRFTDYAIPEEYRSLVARIQSISHLDDVSLMRIRTYADSIAESNLILFNFPDNQLRKAVVKMSFSLILLQIAEKSAPLPMLYQEKHEAFMHWLEIHFRENPTVNQAAEEVGLSLLYFSTWFKKHTGKTYIEYLTMLRLSYACSMLKNGFSITDSCYSSGFGSLSHFNHTFKMRYGVSPGEYQKNERQSS